MSRVIVYDVYNDNIIVSYSLHIRCGVKCLIVKLVNLENTLQYMVMCPSLQRLQASMNLFRSWDCCFAVWVKCCEEA